MIKIVNGNILNCTEDIIVHQVNVAGVMGGGVARQLADKYKGLEEFYSEHCKELDNNYAYLSGTVLFYGDSTKTIANMFSQMPSFETDYIAMEKCLRYIKMWAENNNLSIAIPYGIGCGIANGDWNTVLSIIDKVFKDYEVTLYKLEGADIDE